MPENEPPFSELPHPPQGSDLKLATQPDTQPPGRSLTDPISKEGQGDPLPLTDAELRQLHVRVIALENLVISLLADASDRQLTLAREMAAFILPRPGFTAHPLTVDAAAQMISLVERAGHFRDATP